MPLQVHVVFWLLSVLLPWSVLFIKLYPPVTLLKNAPMPHHLPFPYRFSHLSFLWLSIFSFHLMFMHSLSFVDLPCIAHIHLSFLIVVRVECGTVAMLLLIRLVNSARRITPLLIITFLSLHSDSPFSFSRLVFRCGFLDLVHVERMEVTVGTFGQLCQIHLTALGYLLHYCNILTLPCLSHDYRF